MTPKEWRNVRIGAKLTRLAGGLAFLAHYGRSEATVRFPNRTTRTMSHQDLYRLYKPA